MPNTMETETVRTHFASYKLEETIMDYILSVAQSGNAEDILEAIPPLLQDSGLNEEESVESVHQLIQKMGLESCSGIPKKLSKEINIDQDASGVSNAQLNFQNSIWDSKKKIETEMFAVAPANLIEKKSTITVEEFMEKTFAEDPMDRRMALRELCPCHVKHDVKEFWERIISMTQDPDPKVRYQVLHNLCDGSPKQREEEIIAAIQTMRNDPDELVRRRSRQVLTNYSRTGQWNIL
eukprot:TRINITY_DN8763_c0_g1_i1.p1 TRINITY_DN8763_c0_g1~~TRINITY_DN8763_c0_g1_i1.p1  ORF type:complete len:237 (+),score=92.32 TRINITY_DN8763_c0_g1_i1:93-803(+)